MINKIVKKISKELNIDYDLALDICNFQFKFIQEVMKDPDDLHDILLGKLFSFKLKSKFKDNKYDKSINS